MTDNKFSVKYQNIVMLGGSHHGEQIKVDIIQLRASVSRIIAVPKRKTIKASSYESIVPIDSIMEVEYYRLIYVFDPQTIPYLLIEGGNAAQLFDKYLAEQMQESMTGVLDKLVPGLNQTLFPELIYCPECGDSQVSLKVKSRIVHLNDVHRWSLNKIADYLETLPIDLRVREDAITKRPNP